MNFSFRFGVQQSGTGKLALNVEALPGGALEPFGVDSIARRATSHILLAGKGVPNGHHSVRASPNPSPGSFSFLSDVQSSASGTWQLQASAAASLHRRFYQPVLTHVIDVGDL